ncbi:MAG: type IV conjugative transfer system protein TraE [Pseudomonadota bacterium]|nr:type IV conjugative transfer system protein TraE [Nevskiales bacterium]MEC9358643.1 type IV conjugative transfer system protein TraE [Pseudomonadota bacterium]
MDRALYDSALDDTSVRLRRWRRVAVALLAIDLLLSLRLVTLDTHEKTIIVPPVPFGEFWVRGDQISPSYLEAMAQYFAGLMLTYSPASFAAQKDIVLRHADPSAHGALDAQLAEDGERIHRSRLSQVFYVAQTRVRADHLDVVLSGDLAVFVGQEVLKPRRASYRLRFVQRGGQLYVSTFQEIQDESDPFGDRDPAAGDRG